MIIGGASGHAIEVIDILLDLNAECHILCFDDINDQQTLLLNKYKIINSIEELHSIFMQNRKFCLGVGSPKGRKILFDKLTKAGGIPEGIKASTATIGYNNVRIGEAVDIMHKSFISSDVIINKGVLINAGVHIHHGTRIGKFCEISPNAKILGDVVIGDFCSIGAGAILNPKTKICSNTIIGSGAVVIKDIFIPGIYVGVPARKLL